MSSGVRVKTEPFDFGLLQLSLKLLEHPPSDRENGVQPTTSEEADRRKVDSFFQAIGALLQQLLQELGRFTDSTTLGLFGDVSRFAVEEDMTMTTTTPDWLLQGGPLGAFGS